MITKPTRVTETTSTILDHILTNDVHHCILPGIMQHDLNDYYSVFCTVLDPSSERCDKIFGMKQMVCDLTNFCQDKFISDLEDSLFEFNSNLATKEINYHSFNEIFQIFIQIIKNVINKHCPNKLISRKKQRLNKRPWITKDILNSIRKKQKMCKAAFTRAAFLQRDSKIFMRENLSRGVVAHTRRDSLAAIAFEKNRRHVSNTCDADYILRDSMQQSFSPVITYTRSISTSGESQGKVALV